MVDTPRIDGRSKATDTALQASEARFRTLVETAPALIFAVDWAGRNSFVNERYQAYTGLSFDKLCGDGWQRVIHPDDRAAAIEENIASRTARGPLERRLRIRRHDGAWRWFLSRTEPVAGAVGEATFAWLGISIDIDEQVHAEDRERLLTQEIDHRARNLLAVVQSIVDLTQADDALLFKQAVVERIQALARTHSLLAAGRWDGVELKALIAEELAAYDGRAAGSLLVSGPAICLKPATAQSLGLVLHELATNAAKHGSLSIARGCLSVTWALKASMGKSWLKLSWRESGGPPVSKPVHRGFGSTLISTSVEQQLKGTVSIVWNKGGLACEITLPSECLSFAKKEANARTISPPVTEVSADIRGKSILIVDDESLIAMQIEGALTKAGCAIVGPASTLDEAVDLIVTSKPAAAILDVNLGGARSFPVADILMAKNIPFAFCTGYAGVTHLPSRFANASIISKPFPETALIHVVASLLAGR